MPNKKHAKHSHTLVILLETMIMCFDSEIVKRSGMTMQYFKIVATYKNRTL